MSLRIEEDLAIPHFRRRSTLKVMHSKIVVILRSLQDLETTIVSFEERQGFFFVVHLAICDGLHGVVRVLEFFKRGEDCSCARMAECHAVSL